MTLDATALHRATELADLGRFEEALTELRPAVARNPDDPDVLRLAAHLLLCLGDWREAGRLAARALAQDPDDLTSTRIMIHARRMGGDPHGGSRAAGELMRRNPDSVDALILHSQVALRTYGTLPPRAALRSARLAVRLRPDLPATHHALGSVHLRFGSRLRARRSLRAALSLDPGDELIRAELALVRHSSADLIGAARELARTATGSPYRESLVWNASRALARGIYVLALVATLASALAAWLLADADQTVRWVAALTAAAASSGTIAVGGRRLGRLAAPLVREVAARYPGVAIGGVLSASTWMLWVAAAIDGGSGPQWYRWAMLLGVSGSVLALLTITLFRGVRGQGRD